MSNNKEYIISKASNHTIKKFELISNYVEAWAQKLLNCKTCSAIAFIDCMSNSGEYYDENNKKVFGTPVRVSKILKDAALQYPQKKIIMCFNDICAGKVDHLKKLVSSNANNALINFSVGDGNELLKEYAKSFLNCSYVHYLIIYDPFKATIDWDALGPFFNHWGEVIINHMGSDSIRAVKMAKSASAINKYEQTYLTKIKDLLPYGSDKDAYERRIEEIITSLRNNKNRGFYIAAFPFFNSRNSFMYHLIHCTSNIVGFKLFKETAWKTFGGKSSTKNTHGQENQMVLDFGGGECRSSEADECCFYVKDIAQYLQNYFNGQQNVKFGVIWDILDQHPIFPSDGFKIDIKYELKNNYGALIGRDNISFRGLI